MQFQGFLRSSTMAARKAESSETLPEFWLCPADGLECGGECRGPFSEQDCQGIPACARWNFKNHCEQNPTPPV